MATSDPTHESSTSTIHETETSEHPPMKSPHEANQDIEKPPAWNNNDPPPDGGITAWLVLFGACYYETTLLREHSPSTISWIPSLQVFFMFAMGPIVGKLYDTFGPRHIIGLAVHRILPAAPLPRRLQRHRRDLPDYGEPVDGQHRVRVDDAHRGIRDPGVANLSIRARGTPSAGGFSRESLLRPFGEAKMVLLVLGFVCLTFGVFIPIDYIVVQAVHAGMSAALAQYLVAVLNAGSLFGRLSAGVFSDRVGAYNICVGVVFLAGAVVLGLWIPASGNAAIVVFAVVFGFASGAYVSLAPALVVGISPLQEIRYRTGLLFLVCWWTDDESDCGSHSPAGWGFVYGDEDLLGGDVAGWDGICDGGEGGADGVVKAKF
ncbi:uncharacterized protein CDV56_101682 [Aspergillus thermomutatus]|uniref:Major facilitator superfamily (MFS) profile domain-containing protein n=1 Tax=Aspergillus thermomutatus TaxID=41047 RepID=A0A397GTS0_ASPTH|nr:uncharacterized protein CDV56_101682 [Aspergillus thermomutatus]RHZ54007.1 hypothetical protein CDV56_101682 [Aspergillus thermomutatus]